MALTVENREKMLSWAEGRLGLRFRPDAKALGQLQQDRLVAVVVYDGFSECDCNIHIVSDGTRRWLTREMIKAAFGYPFIQLNLRRITGLVPAKNKAALSFNSKMGFVFEGLCKQALPDDDIVVMGMLRQNCPWIPPEYRRA